MINRNSWVSNSSSSSFIVSNCKPLDLAKAMLKIVKDDWLGYYDNNEKASKSKQVAMFKKWGKSLDTLKKTVAPAILLPSTNYDTYIIPLDPDIVSEEGTLDCGVLTCNNQDWSLLESDFNIRHTDATTEESAFYRIRELIKYFNVRLGMYTSEEQSVWMATGAKSDKCKGCGTSLYVYCLNADNVCVCPTCGKPTEVNYEGKIRAGK